MTVGMGHQAGISAEQQPGLPWVSEVMADPDFALDSEGEFIELCRDSAVQPPTDSFTLVVDGKSKKWSTQFPEPGKAFTICRDSAAGNSWGIPCLAEWSQLSLANGRLIWIQIKMDSSETPVFDAILPVGESGVSQENHAGQAVAADFRPATQKFREGFASPGNCRSVSTDHSGALGPDTFRTGLNPSDTSKALSSRRMPVLTGKTLSLSHPEKTSLGFPTGFTKGAWKLVTPWGLTVASGNSPVKSAWISFADLIANLSGIPSGPMLIVVDRGSKRWMQALVVVP